MPTQTIDNIPFTMKEVHDFSFLSKYGKVFCVFDKNDSGNISFGLDDGLTKYFIKVAGAKTAEAFRDVKDAIAALKNAMPIYEALQHKYLIELKEHYEVEDLYIAVFKWSEGDCLFDHWNFEKYAKDPLLLSPFQKFKQLPIKDRLETVTTIFEFLLHMEQNGYVAVDFYDGSIMYDFSNKKTVICDIDFFRRKPTYNDMGESFWGTKRLKSPEEYLLGATIDGVTNVFTIGALIFHFFGSYSDQDRSQMYLNNKFFPCLQENWELSEELYGVAAKAVKDNRRERYSSINDFYNTWKEVVQYSI